MIVSIAGDYSLYICTMSRVVILMCLLSLYCCFLLCWDAGSLLEWSVFGVAAMNGRFGGVEVYGLSVFSQNFEDSIMGYGVFII